jgi:hypothetical protein
VLFNFTIVLPSIILCITLSYSSICSSWNSEFSDIYPQFTLKAINKLEVTYCKELKWNLYISSSAYAKYYFALRSLTEKSDFRRYLLQFPFLVCFFSFLFNVSLLYVQELQCDVGQCSRS